MESEEKQQGLKGPFRNFLRTVLAIFFRYLYTTLAWSYDAVAWLSSMGQWRTWQSAAVQAYPGLVLELGHGPGHLLLDLEKTGNHVIGVDLSSQMTAIANRRRKRGASAVSLVQSRAQQLPFAAESFEAIVATFPTEYILADETIIEIERVLRAGGQLVVIGLKRITGRNVLDRFAGWLYRFTGQSGDVDLAWFEPLARVGLKPELEIVQQPRAEILRLRARKPAPHTQP
ncbi:MAG: class I SAM-dependent methyltransferase [Anaerolineales bacterium]